MSKLYKLPTTEINHMGGLHQRTYLIMSLVGLTLISLFFFLYIFNIRSLTGQFLGPPPTLAIRSFNTTSLPAGTELAVTLTLTLSSHVPQETFYALEEGVPPEITVLDIGNGNNSQNSHVIRWYYVNLNDPQAPIPPQELIRTYHLRAPATPGTYTFSGTVQFEGDPNPANTSGGTTIQVTACTDECTNGQLACSSSGFGLLTCGNYDPDTCFEWQETSCGTITCEATYPGIHLTGNCQNTCVGTACGPCTPTYPGSCSCESGYVDGDSNPANGCESQDLFPPVIVSLAAIPQSVSANTTVNITATITDDSDLTVTIQTNDSQTLTASADETTFWNASMNTSMLGNYTYTFTATDTNGNSATDTSWLFIEQCNLAWTCTPWNGDTCGERTCTCACTDGTGCSGDQAEYLECPTPPDNGERDGGGGGGGGGSPTFGKMDILRNINTKKTCADGKDNEGGKENGCIDTKDAICGGIEKYCTGGIDNDCDGMIDCADTDCAADQACIIPEETQTEQPQETFSLPEFINTIFTEQPQNQPPEPFETTADVQNYFGFLNWIFLGVISLLFIGLVFIQHIKPGITNNRIPSKDMDQLSTYIFSRLKEGKNPEDIIKNLLAIGWVDDVIQKKLEIAKEAKRQIDLENKQHPATAQIQAHPPLQPAR